MSRDFEPESIKCKDGHCKLRVLCSLESFKLLAVAAERMSVSSPNTNPTLTPDLFSHGNLRYRADFRKNINCFLKLPNDSCLCERILVKDVLEERKLWTVKRQSQDR